MARPPRKKPPTYTVIRDTREQEGYGWVFPKDEKTRCEGTIDHCLPTADYSLLGYEDIFIIERKHSTGELANNLFQDRFEDELTRMEYFEHRFIICEFTLQDVFDFPARSGIPRNRWNKDAEREYPGLKMTPALYIKRLNEVLVQHRVPILFAGACGRDFATSLFKRVIEHVDRPVQD